MHVLLKPIPQKEKRKEEEMISKLIKEKIEYIGYGVFFLLAVGVSNFLLARLSIPADAELWLKAIVNGGRFLLLIAFNLFLFVIGFVILERIKDLDEEIEELEGELGLGKKEHDPE